MWELGGDVMRSQAKLTLCVGRGDDPFGMKGVRGVSLIGRCGVIGVTGVVN